MPFTKPPMLSANSVLNQGSRFRRGSTTPFTHIARSFYCDVLQGQQTSERELGHEASLSFVVEGTRIDIDTTATVDGEPVVLSVFDPGAVAERCWDAGYSVRVGDDVIGEPAVSVFDPFGRRIDLVR